MIGWGSAPPAGPCVSEKHETPPSGMGTLPSGAVAEPASGEGSAGQAVPPSQFVLRHGLSKGWQDALVQADSNCCLSVGTTAQASRGMLVSGFMPPSPESGV